MASHTYPDYNTMEGSLISLGYGQNDTMGESGDKWGEVGETSPVSPLHVNEESVKPVDKPSHIIDGPNEELNIATDKTAKTWGYWGLALLLTFTPLFPIAIVMYVIGLINFVSSMFHWGKAYVPKDKGNDK